MQPDKLILDPCVVPKSPRQLYPCNCLGGCGRLGGGVTVSSDGVVYYYTWVVSSVLFRTCLPPVRVTLHPDLDLSTCQVGTQYSISTAW